MTNVTFFIKIYKYYILNKNEMSLDAKPKNIKTLRDLPISEMTDDEIVKELLHSRVQLPKVASSMK